jgi:hypothetical protein
MQMFEIINEMQSENFKIEIFNNKIKVQKLYFSNYHKFSIIALDENLIILQLLKIYNQYVNN